MKRYIKGEEIINNFTINEILDKYPKLKTDYNDFLNKIKPKINFYETQIGTYIFYPKPIYLSINGHFKKNKNTIIHYFKHLKNIKIEDYNSSVMIYKDMFSINISQECIINVISKINNKNLIGYIDFIQKCFLQYIPELRWEVSKI